MDYQALSEIVPKLTYEWNCQDVQKWLIHVNFNAFCELFNQSQINGYSLVRINPKILSNMGIRSNIVQKKFMKWIEQGFSNFDQYLQTQYKDKQNIGCSMNRRKTQRQTQNTCARQNKNRQQKISSTNSQMKITNYEGPQNVYYIVQEDGIKIGRNQRNQMQSLQVSVADVHAQVVYKQSKFYIQDLGSQSGTFIKIWHKLTLVEGSLVQMGSYLFKVEAIHPQDKKINLKCLNMTDTSLVLNVQVDLTDKNYFSFGRRNINHFWQDDQHMSGTHAKIYFANGKFYIEDMGSTNGTWQRLSLSNQASKPYLLQDKTIFKVGNTITYICQEKTERHVQRMQIQENIHICQSCNSNQRNIVFLPCKHNLVCSECSMEWQSCPLCHHQIEHKIQMFI